MLGFRKRERKIRRIMVVEDEPLVAFDNEHLLGDAGYEVVATVDSLEAAQAVLAEQALDLVLTDISLNGDGDGMDVARAAQARGIPVLFVTGNTPEACEGLGVACLAKPYNDRALEAALAALDDVLQGRKLRKVPQGLTLFGKEPA